MECGDTRVRRAVGEAALLYLNPAKVRYDKRSNSFFGIRFSPCSPIQLRLACEQEISTKLTDYNEDIPLLSGVYDSPHNHKTTNNFGGMGMIPGAIDANDEPIAFMLDHDLVMAVAASV